MASRSALEAKLNAAGIYIVAGVVGERETAEGKEYKVRWEGYGPQDDTWELEGVLSRSAPRILSAYVKQQTSGVTQVPATMETKAASPKSSPPASAGDELADANTKAIRKTPAQTKALNEAFEKSDTLAPDACTKLAASTGLTEKQVREFFTRRRKNEKNKSAGGAVESKKRKGKDDGKSGSAKKKKAASAAGKSPKSPKAPKAKTVKATAAQTEAAIKAIEAIHGPPRLPATSQGTPQGEPAEVAALKAEVQQLKHDLASANTELDSFKAAAAGTTE